ncbi:MULTISPECIES: hypothetical protein [Streptomyces]|uniref:hypothetical protein n=1 Tax=Streptomyces TaxID=1883 RepID=UPI00367FFF45
MEEEEEDESLEILEESIDDSSPKSGPTLTDVEKSVARTLAENKIRFLGPEGPTLKFEPFERMSRPERLSRSNWAVKILRSGVHSLREQLDLGVQPQSNIRGIAISAAGYLETLLFSNGLRVASLNTLIRRLTADGICECSHADGDAHSWATTSSNPRIGNPSLHLSDEVQNLCIEISNASPACMLYTSFGDSLNFYNETIPLSLKIFFGEASSTEAMEARAESIISSLLYELDVRNGMRARTARWPSRVTSRRAEGFEHRDNFVRFPETQVNPEMATLFGFAGSAIDNPPLSFLSYYQVLEFYFPAAVKRSALRRVSKELSDPRFNKGNKEDLLRILKIGERSLNAAEASQLKTLIEECVRTERLEEFFTFPAWDGHFAKGGPIQGVSLINPKNPQSPLVSQVADRIYKIRNRIVHAKDDPRFEDVPALLPQSEEADALWPDIELARLLASEVILDSQTTV